MRIKNRITVCAEADVQAANQLLFNIFAMWATSWRATTILGARGSSCTPRSSNSVSALSSLPNASCARFAARSGIPFALLILRGHGQSQENHDESDQADA